MTAPADIAEITDPAALTTELWARCYVATTEDEAAAQAIRQLELCLDKTIVAHSLTGSVPGGDGWTEFDFAKGETVLVRVVDLLNTEGWDGDVLYPEWRVRPVNPDQVATLVEGTTVRLGDIEDLGYTAPGVGTRDGFKPDTTNLIEPA